MTDDDRHPTTPAPAPEFPPEEPAWLATLEDRFVRRVVEILYNRDVQLVRWMNQRVENPREEFSFPDFDEYEHALTEPESNGGE